MIRRVLAAAVALSLVIPVAAEAKDRLARIDQRVPSAQLQATGSGTMNLVGRLAVNGSIPERGTVTVTDRAGDAQAHLAGVPLTFDRRGRARVARASGILFVSGSNVTVQVTGNRLTFSIAGFGRARLTGDGHLPAQRRSAEGLVRAPGSASLPPPPPSQEDTSMRKLLIAGAAAGLIALPAAAIAETGEPVVETDPAAESQKGPTTDKALHAEGVGAFEYEGSGGVVVTRDGRRDGGGSLPGQGPRQHPGRPRRADDVEGRPPDPLPGHGDAHARRVPVPRPGPREAHGRHRPHGHARGHRHGPRLGRRRHHPEGRRGAAVLARPGEAAGAAPARCRSTWPGAAASAGTAARRATTAPSRCGCARSSSRAAS